MRNTKKQGHFTLLVYEESSPLQHSSKKKSLFFAVTIVIILILGGGILWYLQSASQESKRVIEDTVMEMGRASESAEEEVSDWKKAFVFIVSEMEGS